MAGNLTHSLTDSRTRGKEPKPVNVQPGHAPKLSSTMDSAMLPSIDQDQCSQPHIRCLAAPRLAPSRRAVGCAFGTTPVVAPSSLCESTC